MFQKNIRVYGQISSKNLSLTALFVFRFSLSDKRVASSKLKMLVRDLHNSKTTTSGKNCLIMLETSSWDCLEKCAVPTINTLVPLTGNKI